MRRFLSIPLILLAVLVTAAPAHAQPVFYDQWPGDVRVFLASEFAPPVQQPIPPISVQPQIASVWSGEAPTLCRYLETLIPSGTKVDSCSVSSTGDLQAAMLTSEQLDLRWIVTGNSAVVDTPAPSFPCGGSIKLHGTFDIWLDLIIDVASTISPSGTGTPLSLSSAPVTIHNANVSTDNVCGVGGAIQSGVKNALNSASVDATTLPGLGGQLSGSLSSMNSLLNLEAIALAGNLPSPAGWFDLSVNVTATTLDVTYTPTGPPVPEPPGGPIPPTCFPNVERCPTPPNKPVPPIRVPQQPSALPGGGPAAGGAP